MYFYSSIALLALSLVLYLYWYLKKAYLFFEQHGIPYIKPTFLFGNLAEVMLLRKSLAEAYADLYRELEPHRFAGIFAGVRPVVIIRDPELIKDILIKDFAIFNDRGFEIDQATEPMSNHLFFMKGMEWKNLRIKLTSAFTSGKMKMMFPLVKACSEKLQQVIDEISPNEVFDAKDLSARYMTDVIGSCVFGLETNSLDNPETEFRLMGRKLLKFRFRSMIRMMQVYIPLKLIKWLNITYMDLNSQNFFGDTALNVMNYREKNKVVRNDLLDILIGLKNDDKLFSQYSDAKDQEDMKKFLEQVGAENDIKNNLKLTNEVLAAQAFLFFLAGFETTSTNLCYILLELSQHQHIQDKVRQEIHDVLEANHGQITYDVLKQLTYMEMVIEEALRRYPPVTLAFRKTLKNYKIRDSNVVIPVGTGVIVSYYGLHLDEKYYDDPYTFRPERFTDEEKSKRPNFTYLPFGEGPRHCIGMRLAKMAVKLALIHALKDFSYRVSPKMKFPLEFDKNFGLLTPGNDVLLLREKLNN